MTTIRQSTAPAHTSYVMRIYLCIFLYLAANSVANAEQALKLVSSWNSEQNFTALFLDYVTAVNEAGRGIVQIEFVGGPAVIPQRQLLYALRRGVIDMAFGGITYYRGVIPEGDALFASTISPAEARANGGFDALQPYWKERINAHLIGWMQSGVGASIYLRDAPKFDSNGMPDLSGLKIRTSPTNVEMLTRLGGNPVQIAVKEIFTALQRGTVDGLAFTTIGLPDLGVQRFIRYRIDPSFLQLGICLQINLDVWQELTPAARQILTEQAITYESASRAALFALQDRELAQLATEGLIAVQLEQPYADNYRALAHDVVWQRFAERAPESAAQLRPYFYPDKNSTRPESKAIAETVR